LVGVMQCPPPTESTMRACARANMIRPLHSLHAIGYNAYLGTTLIIAN
jgi:hypothetical protein